MFQLLHHANQVTPMLVLEAIVGEDPKLVSEGWRKAAFQGRGIEGGVLGLGVELWGGGGVG